jgi:hypothetical protein
MEAKLANAEDGRLHQALLAYIHQEFEGAVGGILGCAEMLIEDAEQPGGHSTLSDLRRLHRAGLKLKEVVAGLHHPISIDQDFADFGRVLRHDLRSPIGVIKGFAEMLLEDAADARNEVQARHLRTLIEATTDLLPRVDALADFPLTSRPSVSGSSPGPER